MQKNAKSVSDLNAAHSGILERGRFSKHFERRYYQPSESLRPFIAHIWIQHQKEPVQPHMPLEICSGPHTYVIFTPKEASIHGTVAGELRYDTLGSHIAVGITFTPGGFYPFYKRPMIRLADKTLPAHIVFPEITPVFTKALLEQKDKEIIKSLEIMLNAHSPAAYSGLSLIHKIMQKIDEDKYLLTVAEIARTVGRSERALQLLFQHHVGVSLKWTINRKRLLKTIAKVTTQGSSWTNAAAETGYSNQSHFTREFKQIIGQSPSMYLKTINEDSESSSNNYA